MKFWPFTNRTLFDNIDIGELCYYPSTTGQALIAEILAKNKTQIVIGINFYHNSSNDGSIDNDEYYITKDKFNANACKLDESKQDVIILNKLKDPDNDIIYIRYRFDKTFVDKLYNQYCFIKGRNKVLKIPKQEFEE